MQFIAVYHTKPPQKLLMLCWLSFFRGSSNFVSWIFAHNGSWSIDFGLPLLNSLLIFQVTRPEIDDGYFTVRCWEVVVMSKLAF